MVEIETEVEEKLETEIVIAEQIEKNEDGKDSKEEDKKPEQTGDKIEQREEKKSKIKQRNVAALDGLRTLAIVSVMLYHLGFG